MQSFTYYFKFPKTKQNGNDDSIVHGVFYGFSEKVKENELLLVAYRCKT